MPTFLQWLDEKPERYWWLVCFTLSAVSFAAVRALLRKPGEEDMKTSDWRWGLAIIAVLAAGRWPTLFLTFELNPDESTLVAGATTLRFDPVFWRSVDGGTAGPLNFYTLLPAAWWMGQSTFLSARITALLLIAGALLFAHQSVTLVFGRAAARLGGLSTLLFEALTNYTECLHYSTELTSITLLASAVYLATWQIVKKNTRWFAQFCFALLLGAVPFAKLQAAPLAASIGIIFICIHLFASEYPGKSRQWQLWSALAAGAITPCALFSGMMLVTGELQNAVVPYVLNNLAYIGAAQLSVIESARSMIWSTNREGALVYVWLLSGGALLLTLPLLKRPWSKSAQWFISFAGVLLVISVICILTPRRAFPHYLQFLMMPWTLLVSAAIGLLLQTHHDCRHAIGRILLAATILSSSALIFYESSRAIHPSINGSNAFNAKSRGSMLQALRQYTRGGEAIAVWGWAAEYFVETGLRQATREAVTTNEIFPGPYQKFFRDRYLADFRFSTPSVFIDATKTTHNSQLRNWPKAAHDENFPELTVFVKTRYTKVQELDGSRIYVRNDRLAVTSSRQISPLRGD